MANDYNYDDRVYALFNDFETAATAANDLIVGGFDADRVSVITHDPDERYSRYVEEDPVEEDVEGDEGAGFGAVVGTLTGLAVATIPGFGPVLAAGPLGAALLGGVGAATGAATGALSAALMDFGATETEAENYASVLRQGGALVVVDTTEADRSKVETTLASYRPAEMED